MNLAENSMELYRLLNTLIYLRNHDAGMTINAAIVFIAVAGNEGQYNQRQVAELLGGIPNSTVSRVLTTLSDRPQKDAHGKLGLNWVDQREDPNERRQKLLYLTSQGRTVVEDILAMVSHGTATAA